VETTQPRPAGVLHRLKQQGQVEVASTNLQGSVMQGPLFGHHSALQQLHTIGSGCHCTDEKLCLHKGISQVKTQTLCNHLARYHNAEDAQLLADSFSHG